jgi:proton-translocating NADH-quinone oxidoreductase chain L
MYILSIFLPLITAFIIFTFGYLLGKSGVKILAIFNMTITWLSTIGLINNIIFEKKIISIKFFSWFNLNNLKVDWGFLFDNLSVLMLFTVTLVSLLVHLYSCYYMSSDPHIIRFLGYLSLFTFFMLFLVTSDNFLQFFIGWEGVGLCSYLLINFWFTRIQANKSAMKAVILNRVGDCALLLAITLILFLFKTVDFLSVFALVNYFSNENFLFFSFSINYITLICIFLFIGAIGKSAQIGLHTWLPDAMEGPTPVSALIHAATMVTAGVFLIIRCSILFENSLTLLNFVTIIGSLTAFLAASSAVFQNDIKKVIAYSTCSQLGYMIMSCGVSQYSIAIFHLVNHAFFKALLFLGAGIIIHALNGEQDIRRMGGLYKLLPLTYITMLIASFALSGFPFLAGFYSKEAILGSLYNANTYIHSYAYWMGLISAILTSFYSTKTLYYVFFTEAKGFRLSYLNFHSTPFLAVIPLIILSIFSLFSGFFLKESLISIGTSFFDGTIFIISNNLKVGDIEQMPQKLKLFPIFISYFGFFLFTLKFYLNSNLFFYQIKLNTIFNKSWARKIHLFFSNKWYFDLIINELFVHTVFDFSYNVPYALLDKGIFELLGPTLSFKFSEIFSKFLLLFQNGWISTYMRIILFSLAFYNLFFF